MSLAFLAYYSIATERVSELALIRLLLKARSFNDSVKVTGFLAYSAEKFIQTIEGTPSSVDQVFRRIEGDPMHHGITVTHRSSINHRVYTGLSMFSDIQIERRALDLFLQGRVDRANWFTSGQNAAIASVITFIAPKTTTADLSSP